mmetsp:Transcript_4745/g.6742  ORF Transcript_4745/g.6742 Transcript_4745/m.6742 type:complete len:598 (+) Transcript_4745:188-1981(+)
MTTSKATTLFLVIVGTCSMLITTVQAFTTPMAPTIPFQNTHAKKNWNFVRTSQPLHMLPEQQTHAARNVNSSTRPSTELQTAKQMPPNGETSWDNIEPQVYPQRWVQLGYLSLLALLSDWICFSTAAAPSTFEDSFGHSSASLIDLFLFTNVASCFLVTDTVAKFGLQRCIQGAGVLMAAGCWLRSGFGFLLPVANAVGIDASNLISATPNGLVPYPVLVAGTLMVGAAQPFFQCTPPLLSALWFASDERATSTAVALNFNQIGIATAFLVGGGMATSTEGLQSYFALIAVLCTVVTAGTLLQFQDSPPIPPSSSELEKVAKGEEEPPFVESVKTFFATPGFSRPLAAFICSISITNIVGAFIDEVMERGGVTEQFQIDLAGAGFELAILLGGIFIGGYVDKSKEYKNITLACLAMTTFFLVPLGLTDHAIGKEPVLMVLALLGLGMAAGPVQPINAELAVDVTYPGDETAVESVQQIGGNLVSALLVPVAEYASRLDPELFPKNPVLDSDIRGDVILLIVISIMTLSYFSGFDSPLKRSMADCADGNDVCDAPQLNAVAAVAEGTTTTTEMINGDKEDSRALEEVTTTTTTTTSSK